MKTEEVHPPCYETKPSVIRGDRRGTPFLISCLFSFTSTSKPFGADRVAVDITRRIAFDRSSRLPVLSH